MGSAVSSAVGRVSSSGVDVSVTCGVSGAVVGACDVGAEMLVRGVGLGVVV